MAILEKEVLIGLNSQSINHFSNLKYDIPKYIDKNGIERVKRGTKILVKVDDLPINSFVKLTKICDICGSKVKTTYHKILKGRNNFDNGLDKCKKCSDKMKFESIHKSKLELNSIAKTNLDFSKLLWDQNDAYLYSLQSNKRTNFKCPDCGEKINNKRIQDVYKYGLSCPHCSDSISYPEKFMFCLLKQFNIEFETQKTFKWSNGRRYDFYISSLNIIIETNGLQHYKEVTFAGGRNLKEEQENDLFKKKIALENGIKDKNYIEIDARRSSLQYMRKSIQNNFKFKNLFDLTDINWMKCHEFSSKSLIKKVSELYNSGKCNKEIAKELNICRQTVSRYLKRSEELGWCNYDPYITKHKTVIQLTIDGEYISEFESISIAEKETKANNISNVCIGRSKSSGGFRWMYKENYDRYIGNSINLMNGGIAYCKTDNFIHINSNHQG